MDNKISLDVQEKYASPQFTPNMQVAFKYAPPQMVEPVALPKYAPPQMVEPIALPKYAPPQVVEPVALPKYAPPQVVEPVALPKYAPPQVVEPVALPKYAPPQVVEPVALPKYAPPQVVEPVALPKYAPPQVVEPVALPKYAPPQVVEPIAVPKYAPMQFYEDDMINAAVSVPKYAPPQYLFNGNLTDELFNSWFEPINTEELNYKSIEDTKTFLEGAKSLYMDLYKFNHDAQNMNGTFSNALTDYSNTFIEEVGNLNKYSRDVLFPAMKNAGEIEANTDAMRLMASKIQGELGTPQFDSSGKMILSQNHTDEKELSSISAIENLNKSNIAKRRKIEELEYEIIK